MALKTHVVRRTWDEPGVGPQVVTLCGARGFKSSRYRAQPNEWAAVRQIGGLTAVPADDFMPSRYDDCKTCRRKWEAGEGYD